MPICLYCAKLFRFDQHPTSPFPDSTLYAYNVSDTMRRNMKTRMSPSSKSLWWRPQYNMLLGEADLQGPELSGPLEPRHQQSLGNWVQGQKDQICKTKLDDFSRTPSIQIVGKTWRPWLLQQWFLSCPSGRLCRPLAACWKRTFKSTSFKWS